jgi:hypothetical protein
VERCFPATSYQEAEKYCICSRARRGHDCPGHHVTCRSIEQAVNQVLLDDILTLENLLKVHLTLQTVYLRSASTLEQEHSERTRHLRTVQGRISNLTAAIAEAGHSRSLLDSLAEAERERDRIEFEIEQLALFQPPLDIPAPKLAEIAEALHAELIFDDPDKQRRVLREVIERIIVRREDAESKAVIHYRPIQAIAPPSLGGADLVKY